MKLTRSVSYAVSILLNIARRGGRTPLTAAQISHNCDFPPRFLYRVLRRLVDSGLLTGISGPGGGYRLARSGRRISLLAIVEAVEGPQEPSLLKPVCRAHQGPIDAVNEVCDAAAEQFRTALANKTLADLEKRAVSKKKKSKTRRRAIAKKTRRR